MEFPFFGRADEPVRLEPNHGPGEPRDRPLAVLAELVNEDKHRNLITAHLGVPLREFFGSYAGPIKTVIPSNPVNELFRRYLESPTRSGRIVLVDPAKNVWEMDMEVDTPSIEVVTNTAPQRELLDTLHETRVAVIQAVDEVSVYLGEYDGPRPDRPALRRR